jgi:hypothetical protein
VRQYSSRLEIGLTVLQPRQQFLLAVGVLWQRQATKRLIETINQSFISCGALSPPKMQTWIARFIPPAALSYNVLQQNR